MDRYSIFNTCECESLVILKRDISDNGEWVKYEDIKHLLPESDFTSSNNKYTAPPKSE